MQPSATTSFTTTCPYCGVGCGVQAWVTDARLQRVKGEENHPANLGRLCVKGAALPDIAQPPGRLLHPRLHGVRTDWNTALDHVAASLRGIIQAHGPESVAMYVSGQLLTEDLYVANKLMKGFIGSAHIDGSARLSMAPAATASLASLGTAAPVCCFEDMETCDLLVLAGWNAAWTHPVLFQRFSAARAARSGMRLVVLDPRRTATAALADLHLPLRPGSDDALFCGLLHFLQRRGALDHDFLAAHTEGAEAALQACAPFDLDATAAQTGLDPADLEQFFQWFARTPRTVTVLSQGIAQSASGAAQCQAILNCHLATGRIGQPGMGVFPISGQANGVGVQDVGAQATQLAAGMSFTPESIERVARFWNAPRMATAPGVTALGLTEALEGGQIKALWILGSNPVASLPHADRVRCALQTCPLVIVSDCREHTDTTAMAHVLLPAADWGEKDGTQTSAERRLLRQRALLPAAGEARPDWWIVCDVARRLGFAEAFAYDSPAAIFREHATLSTFENAGKRVFDLGALAGLDEVAYDALPPLPWPVTAQAPEGTPRLFTDRRFATPSGRARLQPVHPEPAPAPRAHDTPFLLNNGRLRDQWLGMGRTGQAPRLLAHTDTPFVALQPRDARSLGLREGDLVELFARDEDGQRHALPLPVRLDPGQRDGELFVPLHWNVQLASHGGVSRLFCDTVDTVSSRPALKAAWVGLRPLKVARWAAVLSRLPLQDVPFDWWVRRPLREGWLTLLAELPGGTSAWPVWFEQLRGALEFMEYQDDAAGIQRVLLHQGARLEAAVFVAATPGALPDSDWLQRLLLQEVTADSRALLQQEHHSSLMAARLICNCFRVSEAQIHAAIAEGARSVEELGKRLRCGTNCGSCLSELQQLLKQPR